MGFIDGLIDVTVGFHDLSVLKHVRPLRAGRQLEEVGGAPTTPAPRLPVPKFDFQTLDPNGSLSRPNFDHQPLPRLMVLASVLADQPSVYARTVPKGLHSYYRCHQPYRPKHPSAGYGECIDGGGNHIANGGSLSPWDERERAC